MVLGITSNLMAAHYNSKREILSYAVHLKIARVTRHSFRRFWNVE